MQIQAVKNQCNGLLEKLNLPDDDARALALIQVRQMCNTIAAVPIKLQQNAEIAGDIPVMLALLGINDFGSLKSLLTDLNKNSKASFLTMVQVALENCVVQVIEAIGGKKPSGKFSTDAKAIINLCGLTDPRQKLELLMLPAWLRNTLHANGIHKRPSKTLIVDGEAFVFEQDKRLQCGSWSHIAYAVMNSLYVYEELLTSSKVEAIQHIQAR